MAEKKAKEGLRSSGRPDMRTDAERSRDADAMVTIDEPGLKRTYRVEGKVYHPGDTKVPKSLASALSLIGKHELPISDERREAPEAKGGPDVKEAQSQLREQAQGPAGKK
jgi:hypothetical protein